MKPVVVIGAGITGLALTYWLKRQGLPSILLEASSRAGGQIKTSRQDGFILEHGPQSIRGGAPSVARIINDLGLNQQVAKASASSNRRFVVKNGALAQLPMSLKGFLRTPLLRKRDRLRAFAEPFRRKSSNTNETVHEFMARRLGPSLAETFGNPFIAGIFGGDPKRLELKSAFPRLQNYEQDEGSIMKGAMKAPKAVHPKGSFTFKDGMDTLTNALTAQVSDELHLDTKVVEILKNGSEFEVVTEAKTIETNRVIVTTPARVASNLIVGSPILPDEEVPVIAVHLAFRTADITPVAGFGWLCSSKERKDVLGCIWVSSTFEGHAPEHFSLFRMMVGGVRFPNAAEWTDKALIRHCMSVLSDIQGIKVDPVLAHVARGMIPQYRLGHHAATKAFETTGVEVAGWNWTGIGVADCLTRAAQLAAR